MADEKDDKTPPMRPDPRRKPQRNVSPDRNPTGFRAPSAGYSPDGEQLPPARGDKDTLGQGARFMSEEDRTRMLTALGLNMSKLGYKPRPAHCEKGETPYAVIEQLASIGLSQRQVHQCLGWSEGTWYSRKKSDPMIEDVYQRGYGRGLALIANRHFESAMRGSVQAMQFILKTKGGFVEPKEEGMGPQETANAIKGFLDLISNTTGRPVEKPETPPEGSGETV